MKTLYIALTVVAAIFAAIQVGNELIFQISPGKYVPVIHISWSAIHD